jgi:peptidoglycan/LPS O-acetylase OafA/YrhL
VPTTRIEETKPEVRNVPAPAAGPQAVGSWAPRGLTPAGSAHLDLIRALAAWAVMWGHVRGHFFVDFQHLTERNLPLRALYFVTGFGHQAVMVFFVLSGFLISSSVIHSYASGRWSWREYAINRSSRLYVVLIPGLLLGLLWDKLGSTLFSATGLYSHPLEAFGGAIARNQMTLGSFTGNLFFLQTILCPTFGSNGPLWSLANEFWYYVLFPLALFAGIAWVKRAIARAVALTLLAASLAAFLGWDKLIGFLIWLAGCGLVLAYSRIQMKSHRSLIPYVLISSAALAGCLAAARIGRPAALGSDSAVGFACAFFLFGVLHVSLGARNDLYRRVAHFFAGYSYSLYVLHFPFVLFLRAWIAPPERWQPDGRHLFYAAAVGGVTLGFAWLVSTFTENKTSLVRQWIKNAIPRFVGE